MMIAWDITRYFQSLNESINKSLKEKIRRKHSDYCIENANIKVLLKQLID